MMNLGQSESDFHGGPSCEVPLKNEVYWVMLSTFDMEIAEVVLLGPRYL